VSLATTGTDLDPDGYALVVAGVTRRVGASDTVTILDLVPGTHIVRIQGIAMNCASAGGSERSVLVESGRQSVIEFAVSCVEWPSPPELAEAELAGTQLLFVRERRIYRTRFDGTGLLVVTENAYAPAWSPDRSHVAFGRGWSGFDSRQPDRGELCIARADGSDARCTTGPAAGYLVGPPSWSPDGSKVAFSLWLPSCPGGNCGQFGGSYSSLHVLDTSTMTVEVLATPQVTSVSWSPNGRRIAFTGFGEGDFGRGALGVVNPDGSGVNILAGSLGEYSMNQVAWSPDGRKLAFVLTNEDACHWFCDMAIATIDAGMGNAYATSLRVLATTRHSDEAYLSGISWAPDGTRIAYTREDCSASWNPCRSDVFVVAAGGGPVTLLLPGAGQPSWGR
jgi:Tol biopolymer transport system component